MLFVSNMLVMSGAAECSVHTCAETQTVAADAATLCCALATAAALDGPAGTVVAADPCWAFCEVPAADAVRLTA